VQIIKIFFLIILEFFNNIQLYLIIYINKLMEIIFQQPEKKKCNKSEFQVKNNFAGKRRLNVVQLALCGTKHENRR